MIFVATALLDSSDCNLIMFIYYNLVTVVLVLASNSQAHVGKIIGGHETAPHSRPYMVHLKSYEKNENYSCGGFLVSEDFVMTAAHCKAESKHYEVCFGMNKIDDNTRKCLSVEQHFPHKDYNETNLTNDIMLLKLSTSAVFNEKVKPIAIADMCDNPPKECIVIGWGITENKKPSLKLLEVNVTLIDKKKCTKENDFCSEGKNGPAEGDSGGPLVCENGKAYGLISGSFLGLYKYTNIPDYTDWIKEIMKPMAD